jgi:plasmid stabilization system protein ParE
MTSYRLSRDASYDVLDIWLYIAKDSTSSADRFVAQLHRTFQQISDGVMTGERFLDPDNREARRISQGNYVIYHRRVGRVTEILRVVHGARLLENLDE